MIEFEKPNIECLEVDNANNYAKFVCEPLERGYGVTIGNSLRRILLSSLPGSAITGVKIEGVLHEFSTIPNVVEDVPEIIVNLKNVRLKLDKNEEKTLRINFKGEGEVTAGDIMTDGTVEVLNPDLHIATVSEGGSLVMDLIADMGRGYNTAEKNKKDDVLGVSQEDAYSASNDESILGATLYINDYLSAGANKFSNLTDVISRYAQSGDIIDLQGRTFIGQNLRFSKNIVLANGKLDAILGNGNYRLEGCTLENLSIINLLTNPKTLLICYQYK